MDGTGEPSTTARYDGYAEWYDAWAQSTGNLFMAAARAALYELIPAGSGAALDLGCGTGLHSDVAVGRGYSVLGTDCRADQLRLAHPRLPVLRADARSLPLPDRSFQLVYSMLTHTDLDGFDRLVAEGVRVLAPGGVFVYVGIQAPGWRWSSSAATVICPRSSGPGCSAAAEWLLSVQAGR